MKKAGRGFTVIEVLIVVGIIAVLAIAAIYTLNPMALLQQARDSNRISGLGALQVAVNSYSSYYNSMTSSLGLGTPYTLYISIPDRSATTTAGDQCQGLGMPALPSGWAYHCASSSTYLKTDGTGWVPLNFANVPGASALGALPVDPTNATSSGLYYTYVASSTNYEFTDVLESQKQRSAYDSKPALSTYPGVYAVGSSLSISPLYSPSGLVGYWNLDEGTGTVVSDSSGNGYGGTATNGPTWTTGKIGNALTFSQAANSYVTMGNVSAMGGLTAITLSAWTKTTSNGEIHIMDKSNCDGGTDGSWEMQQGDWIGNGRPNFYVNMSPNNWKDPGSASEKKINDGSWHLQTGVWDGSTMYLYVDGQLVNSEVGVSGTMYSGTQFVDIGGACNNVSPGAYNFNGTIDDVRIYNRALSAAEVLALYNAQY